MNSASRIELIVQPRTSLCLNRTDTHHQCHASSSRAESGDRYASCSTWPWRECIQRSSRCLQEYHAFRHRRSEKEQRKVEEEEKKKSEYEGIAITLFRSSSACAEGGLSCPFRSRESVEYLETKLSSLDGSDIATRSASNNEQVQLIYGEIEIEIRS